MLIEKEIMRQIFSPRMTMIIPLGVTLFWFLIVVLGIFYVMIVWVLPNNGQILIND
ncbi:hypothetical protein LINPERHAP1_LOCUS16322 [Linum perenne]